MVFSGKMALGGSGKGKRRREINGERRVMK